MQCPISAIVLTRNEEENIARCLNSLDWVEEIIVIDSESSDSTVQTAESLRDSLNIKIFVQPWLGVSQQYQYGIDKANLDWVLIIDADEEVPPELGNEILKLFPTISDKVAYRVPRINRILGNWLKYGGWKESSFRLFNRNYAHYPPLNHPRLNVKGSAGKLTNPIKHYTATDIVKWWTRSLTLAKIEAETRYLGGERFSALKLISGFLKFLRRYTLKLGFLHGWAGFYGCFQRFLYVAAMQASLLELQRGVRKPPKEPFKQTFK